MSKRKAFKSSSDISAEPPAQGSKPVSSPWISRHQKDAHCLGSYLPHRSLSGHLSPHKPFASILWLPVLFLWVFTVCVSQCLMCYFSLRFCFVLFCSVLVWFVYLYSILLSFITNTLTIIISILLVFFVIYYYFKHLLYSSDRRKERVWIWVGGEVERSWEELGRGHQNQNRPYETKLYFQ